MHATVRDCAATTVTRGRLPRAARFEHDEPHVLVAATDARARYTIAGQLLEAGFRITTAGSYAVVEVLLENAEEFDLLVTAESEVSRMTRSLQPGLPMVLVDPEAVGGSGVIAAVRVSVARWPVRPNRQ